MTSTAGNTEEKDVCRRGGATREVAGRLHTKRQSAKMSRSKYPPVWNSSGQVFPDYALSAFCENYALLELKYWQYLRKGLRLKRTCEQM